MDTISTEFSFRSPNDRNTPFTHPAYHEFAGQYKAKQFLWNFRLI